MNWIWWNCLVSTTPSLFCHSQTGDSQTQGDGDRFNLQLAANRLLSSLSGALWRNWPQCSFLFQSSLYPVCSVLTHFHPLLLFVFHISVFLPPHRSTPQLFFPSLLTLRCSLVMVPAFVCCLRSLSLSSSSLCLLSPLCAFLSFMLFLFYLWDYFLSALSSSFPVSLISHQFSKYSIFPPSLPFPYLLWNHCPLLLIFFPPLMYIILTHFPLSFCLSPLVPPSIQSSSNGLGQTVSQLLIVTVY